MPGTPGTKRSLRKKKDFNYIVYTILNIRK
ncbi:hypothetical protein PUN28_003166 [Cardiocondyla obscurior]|uniref:Uncharacterized protein n=1 Tax=Cardiocondyla obscurior TaxID=286306 RepID=A0AAW2GJE0_9HYME